MKINPTYCEPILACQIKYEISYEYTLYSYTSYYTLFHNPDMFQITCI